MKTKIVFLQKCFVFHEMLRKLLLTSFEYNLSLISFCLVKTNKKMTKTFLWPAADVVRPCWSFAAFSVSLRLRGSTAATLRSEETFLIRWTFSVFLIRLIYPAFVIRSIYLAFVIFSVFPIFQMLELDLSFVWNILRKKIFE